MKETLRMKATAVLMVICIFTCTACSEMHGIGDGSASDSGHDAGNLLKAVKVEAGTVVTGETMKLADEQGVMPYEIEESIGKAGIKLLKEIAENDRNVMVSPVSIFYALAMATMGAEGDTLEELMNFLCPGASKKDLCDYVSKAKTMERLHESEYIKPVNSVWINRDMTAKLNLEINEQYLNLLRESFGANALETAFDNETLEAINAWIEKNTNGMIKDMLKELSPDSLMLLVNAMSFEGKWATEYTDLQKSEGVFTNSEGIRENAAMLNSTERSYFEGEGATGFLKNYEGDRYAFLAMLPDNPEISLADFIAGLDENSFKRFYETRTNCDVMVTMPCFKFDYEVKLNDMLKKLGVNKAFNENEADFGAMLEDSPLKPMTQIWIENVLHKTRIELDENGTKAAASTVVEMQVKVTSLGPEQTKAVRLDRPFVFAIVDTTSRTPVFIGAVNSVN